MKTSLLKQWQAEEQAVRACRSRPPGSIPPAEARGRSGLDVLRNMLEGRLPSAPIAEALDFLLVQVGEGRAAFQGRPGPRFFNPMGSVHGGWYATLLDSAVGCAVHTTLQPGRAYTTLELKVNLVRAIGADVPLVRAEGRTIHVGRQVATAEGRLVGPDGRLYAHASTTCMIYTLPSDTAHPKP